jgi:mannose-6-phosphate isomerase-like protein (cupin superfamily)
MEHIRVAFFSWLYDSDEEKLTDKYRKPVKVLELEGEKLIQSGGDDESASAGFRCEFLSADWALTSQFNVAVLTLTPGTELLAKTTENVEFYYVVKGDGNLVSGETKERISTGSAFIVDPGR